MKPDPESNSARLARHKTLFNIGIPPQVQRLRVVAYQHPTSDDCVSTDPHAYANPRLLVRLADIEGRVEVDELTDKQHTALCAFAKRNGRDWKWALSTIWTNGLYDSYDDAPSLQQIRNNLGPAWLVNFKL